MFKSYTTHTVLTSPSHILPILSWHLKSYTTHTVLTSPCLTPLSLSSHPQVIHHPHCLHMLKSYTTHTVLTSQVIYYPHCVDISKSYTTHTVLTSLSHIPPILLWHVHIIDVIGHPQSFLRSDIPCNSSTRTSSSTCQRWLRIEKRQPAGDLKISGSHVHDIEAPEWLMISMHDSA